MGRESRFASSFFCVRRLLYTHSYYLCVCVRGDDGEIRVEGYREVVLRNGVGV